MNSQDITRALIDTTVARAMVEMDADPKRSVRKLCDLGRQFSRGRFQNQIFAIFQDLLRNDESPYYQAIDFLLRSNDPEALRQFGINIGLAFQLQDDLHTVRRFCARSRKNFPLLFPGLSSSVSTAASRTLTIPRFLHPWSEPV